jgi:DtxR family transcriptional regulator, manganese transport regulator
VVDLARRLGVPHVTVNRTLARLKNWVRKHGALPRNFSDRCRTKAGRRMQVAACDGGFFLRSLGISERIAELDAEGIEHHVSPETLAAFEHPLKNIDVNALGLY